MSSAFQALMALSQTQTKQTENQMKQKLAERQRREQERKKQQEEHERREREREKQLRLQHFEKEKKEQEKQKRVEEEKEKREALLARREEEYRLQLLGKMKKKSAHNWPSSSSQDKTKEAVRRTRIPFEEDPNDEPNFLTRQEKREARLKRELGASASRRNASLHHRPGRRLPGGAVDVTAPNGADSAAGGSIKERLARQANGLTKLYTVKRDTRTIDEIVRDRQKAKEKVLDGDEAKNFDDWFGEKKKEKKYTPSESGTSSPMPREAPSATATSSAAIKKATMTSASKTNGMSSALKHPIPKISTSTKTNGTSSSYMQHKSQLSARTNGPSSARPSAGASKTSSQPSSATTKKRPYPQSHSRSESPVNPAKKSKVSSGATAGVRRKSSVPAPVSASRRRANEYDNNSDDDDDEGDLDEYEEDFVEEEEDEQMTNIRSEIWGLFGRKKEQYLNQPVYSDDEDMEAGASDLEREELISARIAKKEDREAEEEERRREEEKRRKKVMLAKRG